MLSASLNAGRMATVRSLSSTFCAAPDSPHAVTDSTCMLLPDDRTFLAQRPRDRDRGQGGEPAQAEPDSQPHRPGAILDADGVCACIELDAAHQEVCVHKRRRPAVHRGNPAWKCT